MKFSIVIGNPPYNKGMDINFIQIGYKISREVCCMIVPAKWQTADDEYSGTNYANFRKEIVQHMKEVVFYPCSKDIFDILQVDGITYFLLDKEVHEKCLVSNRCSVYKILESDGIYRDIRNRQSLSNFVDNIINRLGQYEKFRFNHISMSSRFRVYMNNKAGGGAFASADLTEGCKDSETRKVFFTGASYIEDTLGIDKTCGIHRENRTAEQLVFTSDNKEECENFIRYLNTRFVQMLLSGNQSKLSCILTDDCFRFVPSIENEIGADGKIGYQHKWTDEELYEKYNITEKEQRDIESYVNRRENYGLMKEKDGE